MTTLVATIVVLGVLIFVHELGHFVAAKAVGIEVQRFSIGLGPRVWGFRRGETEYVLSAIPLGGYVKMGGMEDEVMERIEGGAAGDEGPRPTGREFDSKPIWARTVVISAGVVMNMVFAFLAYTAVAAFWGVPELRTDRVAEVNAALLPEGAEPLAGIPQGARIVRVGDRPVRHWGDVRVGLLEAPPGPLTLELAEPEGRVEIRVSDDAALRGRIVSALASWIDAGVGAVNPGSPADRAGLRSGDRILAVDGEPVGTWYDFVERIRARPEQRTELTLLRDGGEIVRAVTPDAVVQPDPASGETVTVGQIGVLPPLMDVAYTHAGPLEAVVLGYRETVAVTGLILGFLKELVMGDVSPRSVGSIVTIGEASGQAASAGLDTFLRFMALFSVNLAILNLLPIPILDGGHLVFLLIEAVRGKALTVEQRVRWSHVGFLIVVGIMLWALSNDFMRLFGM